MKNNFIIMPIILSFFSLNTFSQSSVLLKSGIIETQSEGIAFLGSGITEDDAKTFAINDAKRNALEKSGTYLESHTTIINYKLAKDEVVTFTGSLLKIEIISEKREIINNMFAYKVVLRATIDTKLLENRIMEIRKNKKLKSQLEFQAERIKYLEQQINKLKDGNKNEVKRIANALNANELFEKAYNAYYKGDYKTAIEFFNKALYLDNSNIGGFLGRAYCFRAKGQFKKEKEDYYKAIKIKPQNINDYSKRGHAFGNLNMFKNAIEDYNIAISIDSTNWIIYDSRGQVYLKNGNFQKAIDDYSRVIFIANTKIIDSTYNDSISNEFIEFEYDELEFYKIEAYLKRSEAYFKMKRFDRALEDCNISLLLFKNNEEALIFRGLIYKKLGLYQKSAQDFNKFLKIVKRNNKENEFIKEFFGEVFLKKEIVKRNKKIDKVRKWVKDMGYKPLY